MSQLLPVYKNPIKSVCYLEVTDNPDACTYTEAISTRYKLVLLQTKLAIFVSHIHLHAI